VANADLGELIRLNNVIDAERGIETEVVRADLVRISEELASARRSEEELERIRGQVADLRNALANAKRESQERYLAEEATRSEVAESIATLNTELANARQVGRVALQALVTSGSNARFREPRLSWRQMVRRLF
jgi:hypothetical protein